MPRVTFVKKARKPNRLITQEDIDRANAGIEGAASYYWWKFRYGGTHLSKTPPKASQLTQSEYLGQAYGIEEEIADFSCDTMDELESFVEEKIDEIRTLGEEQTDKLYNMPDQLQDSDSGQLLQSRADACEAIVSELESIDFDLDESSWEDRKGELLEEEDLDEEALEEKRAEWEQEMVQEKIDELQSVSFEWEC
jgi:hypothetical protein